MTVIQLAVRDAARAKALLEILRAEPGWQFPAAVHTVAATRAALIRQAPALLLADLRLHDGGMADLVRVARSAWRQAVGQAAPLVLLLAEEETDPMLLDALQAGADNFFLLHAHPVAALRQHVQDTLAGGADIAPWIARRLLDHFDGHLRSGGSRGVEDLTNPLSLTAAEHLLLRQLSIGDRLADVARHQGVLPRELTSRVRDIYRKMQWALHAGNLRLS